MYPAAYKPGRIDPGKSHYVDAVGATWEPPYKIRPDRASQSFNCCYTPVHRVRAHPESRGDARPPA